VNSNPVDPIQLKPFVSLTMDIASASPRRYFFEARTNVLIFFILTDLFLFASSNIYIYVSDMMSKKSRNHRSWKAALADIIIRSHGTIGPDRENP
jgi:CRP-like cAMP-binding protein